MPKFRSFYPSVEPELVLNAQDKTFPLRATAKEAAQDAQMWRHKEGEVLIPYRIEPDGEVVPMKIWVHRVMEVVDAQ